MDAQKTLRRMQEKALRSPTLMGVKTYVEGPAGPCSKKDMFKLLEDAGRRRDGAEVAKVCGYLVRSSADAPLPQLAQWSDALGRVLSRAQAGWNSSELMQVRSASGQMDEAYRRRALHSDRSALDRQGPADDREQKELDGKLREAARRGDLDEVRRLVKLGADPCAKQESWPYDNAVSAAMGDGVYEGLAMVDGKHQEVVDYLAPLLRL